jgi:hypothetical protein
MLHKIKMILILGFMMALHSAYAQYTGGNGRGDYMDAGNQSLLGGEDALFSGGNGRGDIALMATGLPIISCSNPTRGGAISAPQSICNGATPAELINDTLPVGYTGGTLEYQWQSSVSDSASGFTDISAATEATYTPEALTQSTWFRRLAKVSCVSGWVNAKVSNVVKITVYAVFGSGAITTTGETICHNGNPALISNSTSASGGDGTITYSWRSSADSYTNVITGATNATYDPPAGLTTTTSYRRYAKDGSCNTTPTVSTGTWTVTVRQQFIAGAITTTGETICYNGNPVEINSATAASGGDNSISYQWQKSTTDGSSNFADITGATGASYDPTTGLTQTTWYRRLAKDGTCNTTFEAATGVWQVTVRPLFTAGAITTTGETICHDGNPVEISSATAASGGDNSISYQWQKSTTDGSSNFADITGATAASYDPPTGLTQTTWYRRLAKDGTCNTTFEASTGVWQVTVRPLFTAGAITTTRETIC